MPKFHVIIPAAGSGSRMGSQIPKQYLLLGGRPILQTTLAVFVNCPRINSLTLVISPEDQLWDGANIPLAAKVKLVRQGGATRAATVLNGLHALQEQAQPDDWVLVHDAARPGLSAAMLIQLLDTLQDDPIGGLLAVPLADTLKRADHEQRVASTEPRDGLWLAQTPQMFRYDLLKRALLACGDKPTDEAQAVEALGFKPKLVAGELRNLKITYPQDLVLAEAILKAESAE